MQFVTVLCLTLVALLAAAEVSARAKRRYMQKELKREDDEGKQCCLPNTFTAFAKTVGFHEIREPKGWERTDYTKTQTVVKSGNKMYKAVAQDDDVPEKVLLHFFNSNGYQFNYYADDNCWSKSEFFFDAGDLDAQSSFCMDDGPYSGQLAVSSGIVDVWTEDTTNDQWEDIRLLYAKENSRGECVPVFEEKDLIIPGGQKSDANTTFVLREPTKAEMALLDTPAKLCSFR